MPKDSDKTNWSKYASIGLEMAVGIILGVVIGQWLDKRYHWNWATVVGALLGFAAGFYLLIKNAMEINRD